MTTKRMRTAKVTAAQRRVLEPKHMDGLAAAIASENTAMCKQKGERDTAFVKRIVCAYINALPEANEIYQTLLSALGRAVIEKEKRS